MSGSSSDLQKLLRYFRGTTISTSAVLAALVLPVIFTLHLNDSESAIAAVGSSLLNCQHCQMPWNNFYYCTRTIYTLESQHQDILRYPNVCCLFRSCNL